MSHAEHTTVTTTTHETEHPKTTTVVVESDTPIVKHLRDLNALNVRLLSARRILYWFTLLFIVALVVIAIILWFAPNTLLWVIFILGLLLLYVIVFYYGSYRGQSEIIDMEYRQAYAQLKAVEE